MIMQKITPHLWFDKEAKEAAELYVSIFGKSSKIKNISTLDNTPSGSVDLVSFELLGREFMAISAGPLFKFNPSVSFHVLCKTKSEVDAIWEKLSEGGTVLMELGAYPFSERYGWVQDRFRLSWQINFFDEVDVKEKITPVIMFVGKVCGKAEEAINFWSSVFREARVANIFRYGKGQEPDKEGTVKYAAFSLLGQEFGAMDSAHQHLFAFNEAISFIVNCEKQEEIDYYWRKLSADSKAEQCGWLKDKYGLSWQIVPSGMGEMLKGNDREKIARVTQAFLKMKKFDIAELEQAADDRSCSAGAKS
jgi:predicted 3-demethylubiquinone-9 3-methyltransferase (glyoxalase superfamily)